MTTYKAALQVQPDATLKFCKVCPIPFTIKDAVKAELNCPEGEGILQRVSHCEAVSKKDGKFRICGDYKVTVNGALDAYHYPLPKPTCRSFCYTSWRPNLYKTRPLISLLRKLIYHYIWIHIKACMITLDYHLLKLWHLSFSKIPWIWWGPSCGMLH